MLKPKHMPGNNAGFLFCFKKASHIDAARETTARVAFQRLVQSLTNSDIVHVEILAIRHCTHHKFTLYPYSYNTLLAPGFHKNSILKCLGPAYDILYMPMDAARTQRGVRFLDSLLNYPYNIWGLGEAWLHQFIPERHRRTHAELVQQAGRSVFCTQAALRLCYVTECVRDDIAPEYCTPSQMHDILLKNGAALIHFDSVKA